MSRRENRADLKSLEAALAELSPRADGLNRDRIMFLAGQASAARGESERAPQRRWMWPASLAAMSALAATLLIMLVVQPERQVVTREVPRSDQPRDNDASDVENEEQPILAVQPFDSDSSDENDSSAMSQAIARRMRRVMRLPRGDAPYLELRDRVLAFGLDDWSSPRARTVEQTEKRTSPSYHRLRQSLMGGQGQI